MTEELEFGMRNLECGMRKGEGGRQRVEGRNWNSEGGMRKSDERYLERYIVLCAMLYALLARNS